MDKTFCNITESDFLSLRDFCLKSLLSIGAYYQSIRNGKKFLYKKSEKVFQSKLNSLTSTEKEKIEKYFSLFSTKDEAFYCLRFKDSPFNHVCPTCGNFSSFSVDSIEYNKTCGGKSCYQVVIHSPEALEKIKKTNLKKYGYENVAQSPHVKERMKETCLKRFGVEHALSSRDVIEKRKKTNLDKYGSTSPFSFGSNAYKELMLERYNVDNPFKSEEIKNKIRKTNIEKYGHESAMQSDSIKQKAVLTRKAKISEIQNKLNATLEQTVVMTYGNGWYFKKHELGIKPIIYGSNKFISQADIEKIKEYNESNIFHGTSHEELELQNFVKSICSNVITNDRKIIQPKEIDIYCPDKKIGIEYNGLFWHSSLYRGKNYHSEKTSLCNKAGIRLIQIYSDEWVNKKDICKSIISSALGIYSRKIFARNCIVKEISNEAYKDFLIENHIQGYAASTIRFGLFYNDELIQVAGWGKSRFKNNEIELIRMASKKFTQVVGGFSKLIKASKLKTFISYVDLRIFDGNGYKSVGFSVIGKSSPSYFYIDKTWKTRMNRIQFQKHKLSKILDNFNENLTEEENMLNNGFYRIYDCGELKLLFEQP